MRHERQRAGRRAVLLAVALTLAALLAGCGGAGGSTPDESVPTAADMPGEATALATATATPTNAAPTATATSASQAATAPAALTATPTPEIAIIATRPPIPRFTPTPGETAAASATPEPTATETSAPDPGAPVIVLDPGHDHTSPGALGIEYQVNLRAAEIAKEALEAAGYTVYITRTDNATSLRDDPSLLPPNWEDMHPGYGRAYAQASKALEYDPDMVIALHHNGHPNPDVRGVEVYYCEMGGPQNLEAAMLMRDELVQALLDIGYETPGTRVAEDLGVARGGRHFPSLGNVYTSDNDWVESRYAGIPVVLTEPLYMTNPIEYALIEQESTHRAIAQAYVRFADAWFGR